MDNFVLLMGTVFAGIFGIMLLVYLTLSFICWLGEAYESKSWRFWE